MRAGFSLVELLIVVAILAVLVGVALPFFRSYTGEAQRSKAEMDLQVLRKAIHRYQGANGHFGGATFEPLLGRFLQEIPRDPWGNDYFLDGNLGILGSFGADGVPGGDGGDQDVAIRYLPPLSIFKVAYHGPMGVPRDGVNRLTLWTTKPYHAVEPFKDQIPRDVVLRKSPATPEVPFHQLSELSLYQFMPSPATPSFVQVMPPSSEISTQPWSQHASVWKMCWKPRTGSVPTPVKSKQGETR